MVDKSKWHVVTDGQFTLSQLDPQGHSEQMQHAPQRPYPTAMWNTKGLKRVIKAHVVIPQHWRRHDVSSVWSRYAMDS